MLLDKTYFQEAMTKAAPHVITSYCVFITCWFTQASCTCNLLENIIENDYFFFFYRQTSSREWSYLQYFRCGYACNILFFDSLPKIAWSTESAHNYGRVFVRDRGSSIYHFTTQDNNNNNKYSPIISRTDISNGWCWGAYIWIRSKL